MNTFRTLFFLIFYAFSFAITPLPKDCLADTHPADNPSVVASLLNGNLTLLVVSTPQKKNSGPDKVAPVLLSEPTRSASKLKHYSDGGYFFFGSPTDGTVWNKFGKQSYRKMMFQGKTAELNSFQQEGESWFAVIDETLYQETEGTAVAVAAVAFRTYKTETGEERRAFMTQKQGDEKNWYFESGDGKIFSQDPAGKIRQVGFMEWRVVALPRGEKVLIPMTKGMSNNAHWSGKYNAIRYVEK